MSTPPGLLLALRGVRGDPLEAAGSIAALAGFRSGDASDASVADAPAPEPDDPDHPDAPRLAWRNELGGETWRAGDLYLKWSPHAAGIDLSREARRLRWLEGRHPAPRLLAEGDDGTGQWMLTAALPGESAVAERWRRDPERAVLAIAQGLVQLHALPIDEVPPGWESWATREPPALGPRPPIARAVLVHGDACSPNTVLDDEGRFLATVDVGDLAVADAWADLAVAAMSLEWNYGPGWDGVFYEAYGVDPDPERIAYYRALWHAES